MTDFSHAWARALEVVGLILIAVGIVAAVLVAVAPRPYFETAIGPVDRGLVVVAALGLSLVIGGPLVVTGQLMLALLDIRATVQRLADHALEDRVGCPYCAEDIRPDAVLCPHCRSDLRRETKADRLLTPRS
jgi:hypothetical protein